eukprot:COSAG01_NODE_56458_length_318_cov_0.922374_1_plen_100_part_10
MQYCHVPKEGASSYPRRDSTQEGGWVPVVTQPPGGSNFLTSRRGTWDLPNPPALPAITCFSACIAWCALQVCSSKFVAAARCAEGARFVLPRNAEGRTDD